MAFSPKEQHARVTPQSMSIPITRDNQQQRARTSGSVISFKSAVGALNELPHLNAAKVAKGDAYASKPNHALKARKSATMSENFR